MGSFIIIFNELNCKNRHVLTYNNKKLRLEIKKHLLKIITLLNFF